MSSDFSRASSPTEGGRLEPPGTGLPIDASPKPLNLDDDDHDTSSPVPSETPEPAKSAIFHDEAGRENDSRPRPSPAISSFDADLRDCIVSPAEITATFDDVYVNQSTVEALDFLAMSFLNPHAFTFGVLSRARAPGVLLYGPPGTGKSLLIKALAKQTHATMITLTDADVRSKYVGVGEQKIKRIFVNARRNYPCIIFIDEADSIFGSRTADKTPTSSHICDLNQFLVEIDGIKADRTRSPMIVAATNRPFAMDEGILRRLGMRIMVDLPTIEARERILSIHLRDEPLSDDVNLTELAQATPDYTGSDLSDLVTAAARYAERDNMGRMGIKTSFWETTPISTASSTLTPPLPSDSISRRLTSRKHFLRAKDEIRPAPITETVAKIREFHNAHGSTGYTGYSRVKKVEITNKMNPLKDV
ncbi:hypothetical protein CEP54_004710 [Fusarium duplospermum]|uniref:AAA+ ATPase domain-containing protein n=1 Tax=Fusarium duplospermum TaxID=1325734 RepID=A0A428QH28_9HYPO|nr:hypothetical protein CEP54_004710 [Fusarium duplospermum]